MSLMRVLALEAVAEDAKKTAVNARISLMRRCSHPEIVEGKYVPSGTFTSSRPPFRVCKRCGFAEYGWGCGYSILNNKDITIPEIERDEALKFAVFGVQSNEHTIEHKLGRFDTWAYLKQRFS